jgi:hypothetical protein
MSRSFPLRTGSKKMTDQEFAEALLRMIREDAKRPPEEQIRDLIEAGIIDEKGQVIVGRNKKAKRAEKNGPSEVSSPRKVTGT